MVTNRVLSVKIAVSWDTQSQSDHNSEPLWRSKLDHQVDGFIAHVAEQQWVDSSPEEKDSWVLVGEKLNRTRPCALAAQQPSMPWAASPAAWARGEEGGFCPSAPLC